MTALVSSSAAAGVGPVPVRGQVVRTRGGRVSFRWDPRTLTVCAALAVAVLVVVGLSLTTGAYPVPLPQVVDALVGRGSHDTTFIVDTVRLPRLLTALLVGGALGTSGAVFQSLSGNPLGSPDIVGFTSGAATGAVLEILVLHGGQLDIAAGAMVGGLATAALVIALSWRRGLQSYRMVLMGIGVAAMMSSVTVFLLTRATLYQAEDATVWLVGSLNGVGWSTVVPLAVALGVLVPATLVSGRNLAMVEMGDDAARALGVPVGRSRLVLTVAGTALAAAAVAAAGPITFVALAAPQLVRRLTRAPGPHLVASGLMGAVVLEVSDFGAQRVWPSTELPVGVMTGVVGGVYLAWLLSREWRSGRA